MSALTGIRRRWGMRCAGVLALVLTVAALAAGCDGDRTARRGAGDPAAGSGAPVAVVDVPLPPGYEPVVVTPWGDDLLVGSRAPEGASVRPRLTVFETGGGSRDVPVAPVSPTAFQAKWLVAAPGGGGIDLVGGAPAGAHSNTRWSTWRGDASAVRELPQPFQTFGGWGAGALVSLVHTPSGPVLVGSWESAGAGLDIAVWHPSGERWERASSTGTALASTPDSLVAARSATADRDGVLVVGSVTVLGSGEVSQRAAVWRAPTAHGPWTRTDLPGDGALGEAHAASCDDVGRCTVVGEVDGTLRGWTVPADGAPTALALPALPVGEHDLLTAPLPGDDGPTVVLASGGALVVLTLSGSPPGSVEQQAGPPATTVRSAARLPGPDGAVGTYAVIEDAGAARLVRLTSP